MDMRNWPPSLRSLHRLRWASAELAREQLRQARERLRHKERDIDALENELLELDTQLRRRGQASLQDQEFQRLARVWKKSRQQLLQQARQMRAELLAERQRLLTHLQACRQAVRTLERHCHRMQAAQQRRQTRVLERDSDERWLTRAGGIRADLGLGSTASKRAQPWI